MENVNKKERKRKDYGNVEVKREKKFKTGQNKGS
jgi:hypothetical protein